MSSQKITGKNLHYDQSLPPFLARLKGQHAAAAGDGPDPLLASRRRAAKTRSASEEAEDAPIVVDDEGHVVAGARVGADGTVTGGDEAEEEESKGEAGEGAGAGEEEEDKNSKAKEKEKVAAIGAAKKRKVGRIVGADAEDEGDGGDGGAADKKRARPTAGDEDGEADPSASTAGRKKDAADDKSKAPGKAKKKAKKIKLSFGDDGD